MLPTPMSLKKSCQPGFFKNWVLLNQANWGKMNFLYPLILQFTPSKLIYISTPDTTLNSFFCPPPRIDRFIQFGYTKGTSISETSLKKNVIY